MKFFLFKDIGNLRKPRSIYILVPLCLAVVRGKIQNDESYLENLSPFNPSVTNIFHDSSMCRNFPFCHYIERMRGDKKIRGSLVDASKEFQKNEKTAIESRSYYGGYGSGPLAPALYPAIDTVSVLASLAFLAFLLHSFASLFDRSRSIIPSIVSNRRASGERGMPDPVNLVLRALDEYDILSNNMDPKSSVKNLS